MACNGNAYGDNDNDERYHNYGAEYEQEYSDDDDAEFVRDEQFAEEIDDPLEYCSDDDEDDANGYFRHANDNSRSTAVTSKSILDGLHPHLRYRVEEAMQKDEETQREQEDIERARLLSGANAVEYIEATGTEEEINDHVAAMKEASEIEENQRRAIEEKARATSTLAFVDNESIGNAWTKYGSAMPGEKSAKPEMRWTPKVDTERSLTPPSSSSSSDEHNGGGYYAKLRELDNGHF